MELYVSNRHTDDWEGGAKEREGRRVTSGEEAKRPSPIEGGRSGHFIKSVSSLITHTPHTYKIMIVKCKFSNTIEHRLDGMDAQIRLTNDW